MEGAEVSINFAKPTCLLPETVSRFLAAATPANIPTIRPGGGSRLRQLIRQQSAFAAASSFSWRAGSRMLLQNSFDHA